MLMLNQSNKSKFRYMYIMNDQIDDAKSAIITSIPECIATAWKLTEYVRKLTLVRIRFMEIHVASTSLQFLF